MLVSAKAIGLVGDPSPAFLRPNRRYWGRLHCLGTIAVAGFFSALALGQGTSPRPPTALRVQPGQLHVTTFQLTPHGLSPARVTLPKGGAVLALNNGLRADTALVWEVVRDTPANLAAEAKIAPADRHFSAIAQQNKRRQAGWVDLQPGNYLLRIIGNPGWTARIEVKP